MAAVALSAVLRVLSVCALVALGNATQVQAAESAAVTAEIPAQPLAQALAMLADQTGLQLVYLSEIVRNKKSHAVSAGLGADAALTQLLQDTGLRFEHLTESTVRIVAATISARETRNPGPAAEAPVEVIITGTRLGAANEVAVSPTISVSAAELQVTGLTRVEDVLNTLPMFSASTSSTVDNFADGTAAVNLRGLGNQRTLVLVDGTRLGPGSADGRNWSDLNQIPAALVARVDVLTGGASAVYGADAVAGVVNLILDTHMEGVRVDLGSHISQHYNNNQDGVDSLVSAAGDVLPPGSVTAASGETASVVLGTNFAGDRGNLTGYATYDKQAAALQSQYDYSACALTPPATAVLMCGGSDTSRGGRFTAFSNSGTLLDDTVDPRTGVFRPFSFPGDDYNYAPVNYFQVPNERWTGGAFLQYEFNPHADVYSSVMSMRNSMTAQLAPSGDFGSYTFIPCADPLLTAQEVATLCAPGNIAANGGNYEVYDGKNYPGLDLFIFRRNVEGGNRTTTFVNEAARAVLGIKGAAGNGWTYDIYAQGSTVHIDDSDQNDLGDPQIAEALNVFPGAKGPVCGGQNGSVFTPDPKCVPWNIWVPGEVTPASLAFMSVPSVTTGSVTEQLVSGSASGDLGQYGAKLPAAEQGLRFDAGAEWRKERSTFVPNFEQQQGDVAGSNEALSPVAGEFTVKEVFTEMRLQLVAHRPFADDLSTDGGYRYSSYSSGFNTNTDKLGLEWAPLGTIRLRGGYQHAVRAPNINELFSLQSLSADGTTDPCAGTPTASLAACQLTGVTAAEYGHILPSSFGSYNGLTGGNPGLQPEVADTYTVSLAFQPGQGLRLAIDYFDIRIKGVIGAVGADTIMSECLASVGNPAQAARFCPLIHRDPQGSLWLTSSGYVSDLLVNEGALATRGIDINGSYQVLLPTSGSLLFTLVGTDLQGLQTTPVQGLGSYDCAGYFGTLCGVATPRWRHMLSAVWSPPWHGVALGLRWRYIGSSESALTSASPFLSGTPYLPFAHIAAYSYFDLNATVNLNKKLTLRLGVNNIADKAPPLVIGNDCAGTAGGLCNGNTFPGLYDAMGRYLFLDLSAQW